MARKFLFPLMLATTAVQAAPLPVAPQLTLSTAEQLAVSAREACAARGKAVTIAVLDAGGQTVLLGRGDGVGPHNTEAARRKAYSALSTKTATLHLGRAARANPDTANLANLPELLLLGGGVPLWQGDTLVGAIGVAGGGGPEGDDTCARAALAGRPDLQTR